MIKLYRAYQTGIRQMGPIRRSDIVDEWKEFLEEPSWNEFFDVVHGCCQLIRFPLVSFIFAYPTARKHALRVIEYGCARSLRNHEKAGDQCSCR